VVTVETDLVDHTFRSMGTTIRLVASQSATPREFRRVAGKVEAIFAREDRRFSRFRQDSELSRVNARAGRWTTVSRPFRALVAFSLTAARMSGGLFDPTVLPALLAAGYDRDYGLIKAGGEVHVRTPPPSGRAWEEVRTEGDRVLLPPGVALDFGGVAKGWTVDLACQAAKRLPWTMIEAGGDLRLIRSPSDGGVEIGIEDPDALEQDMLSVRLSGGALATTSITSRMWGPRLHQVIDPRTSRPAITGVVQATAWAPTCAEAEVLSTWALLAGPPALDDVVGVLVLEGGQVIINLDAKQGASHEEEARSARGHLEPAGAWNRSALMEAST
jgi:FAD:protein FMN transferase